MIDEVQVEITRIRRVEGDSKLKAFVDISVAGWLVKGLRVVEGKNGLFLDMPRQQGKDGRWYEIVSVSSKEMRQELADMVLSAYKA